MPTQDVKIYPENVDKSFIEEINVPGTLHPGEEKIKGVIVIKPHKNILKISFLWADKCVKVVCPYMSEENIFEFPPDDRKRRWFLKVGVDNSVKIDCNKQVLVIVEEIIEKKLIKNLAKLALYFIIILSFIPIISNYIKYFDQQSFISLSIGGAITLPLPIITILSLILLSNRIKLAIERLSSIKEVKEQLYVEKAITGEIKIRNKNLQRGN